MRKSRELVNGQGAVITTISDTDQDTEWRSRVRAALVLATWADTLGANPETAWAVATGGERPAWTLAHQGTRMRSMWVLAEHLSRHGGAVVPAELGRALVGQGSHGRAREKRSPGLAPGRVPPARAWSGTSMASRGLLSRSGVISTVPVGLVPGIGLATVAQRARRAAALTQPHPQALDVAAMQAVAVAVVARSAGSLVEAHAVVTQITTHVRAPGLHTALGRVPAMARQPGSPQRVAMQLHAYPAEVSTVPVALTAFLLHPDDPLAAIRLAVRAGGDARAAAAMTGAICGAHHGERALPQPVEIPADLSRITDALARLRDAA